MEKRVDLINTASRFLAQNNITSPLCESEMFLAHILGCHRRKLYLDNDAIEKEKSDYFWQLLNQRAKGLPLQYLLGSTEFMGLEFKARPGVFIPRPETEILVETVINILTNEPIPNGEFPRRVSSGSRGDSQSVTTFGSNRRTNELTILDIGTGCGNIAISLAKYLQKANIFACDISDSALQLAKENASLNAVKVGFVKSDLFSAFKKKSNFSLIVSNPPYIKRYDIPRLPRELNYEPTAAYDGGQDGFFYYRKIINKAADYLQDEGIVALEIGAGQWQTVEEMFRQSRRFRKVGVINDYNDVERVITAEKVK